MYFHCYGWFLDSLRLTLLTSLGGTQREPVTVPHGSLEIKDKVVVTKMCGTVDWTPTPALVCAQRTTSYQITGSVAYFACSE